VKQSQLTVIQYELKIRNTTKNVQSIQQSHMQLHCALFPLNQASIVRILQKD